MTVTWQTRGAVSGGWNPIGRAIGEPLGKTVPAIAEPGTPERPRSLNGHKVSVLDDAPGRTHGPGWHPGIQRGKPLFVKRLIHLLFPLLLMSIVTMSKVHADEPIRVLVITGGHSFETNQFFQIFKEDPGLQVDTVAHPNAHTRLRPDTAHDCDVLVLYDMWQEISEEAKTNLINRLKAGTGLVALHHSLANYQQWPEFRKIVGGRLYLEKSTVDGVEKPPSVWKHDVDFKIHIADPAHPVTRGLADFEIHDETYGLFDVLPDVHPLLTTEEPTSGKIIGWARTNGASRVVYIQLGHDHHAYENPNYRRLVNQAVHWTARRD